MIRVIFNANNNGVGVVKDDSFLNKKQSTYLYRDKSSPLLDTDIKEIYPPDELEIKVCRIKDRYILSKCNICGSTNTCAEVTTDVYLENKMIKIIHCSDKNNFYYYK